MATGEVLVTFTGDGAMGSCAVAVDGVTVVVGDWSGVVHFLRSEMDSPLILPSNGSKNSLN
ncbi:MAG: hypothetical protein JWS08_04480 [Phormidium sp. PBR-2020]|nr:MAG: hypothetical protein JWS08_04480 [Phormidium sp. PBR-2020]